MKLNELDHKKSFAAAALKENYAMPFTTQKMGLPQTQTMLRKVRGLIAETKASPSFHASQTAPGYMKLVFMEQALADHYNNLLNRTTRIVVENEEVEKSQVVLAAQDMVDSIQKMLEDIGQMQVKELPALVSSIESEIGVNESQTYDQEVSQQLDALSAALKEAFAGLKSALGTITGQGAPDAFEPDAETDDLGMDDTTDLDFDSTELSGDGDEESMTDISVEEPPEEMPVAGAGRTKR